MLCDQVDAICNEHPAAGFADTGSGGTGKTYACDVDSIAKWTAMASLAQPFALGLAPEGMLAPTFQPIPTYNSIPLPMTAAATYAHFAGRVMPWVSATMLYAHAEEQYSRWQSVRRHHSRLPVSRRQLVEDRPRDACA